MLCRVGHDVPKRSAHLGGVDADPHRVGALGDLQRDAALPEEWLDRQLSFGQQVVEGDHLRSLLQDRGLGVDQLTELDDHARQRAGRGPRAIELLAAGGDDTVDHRLELRLEDCGRRREVMSHVAGGAAAQHLGSLDTLSHGVECAGQLGRVAIGAADRARTQVALTQARGGRGHIAKRLRQPSGQVQGYQHHGQDREDAGDHQCEIEHAEEGAIGARQGDQQLRIGVGNGL